MSKVEALEKQVISLSAEEFTNFRNWFFEFEWEVWDRQIERDAKAGKLDAMAKKALEDHSAGRTSPL